MLAKTAAIFRQPSILRNLICPLATRLKSKTTAASSLGSEPCVFTRRPKLPVEPFYHVRGSKRLPLHSGEAEKREDFVAAFPQTRHDARALRGPRTFEGGVRRPGRVGAGRVDDSMEVVADRREGVLRRFAFQVAQLVHTAPLHGRPRPHEADGAAEPGVAIDNTTDGAAQADHACIFADSAHHKTSEFTGSLYERAVIQNRRVAVALENPAILQRVGLDPDER